MQSMPAFPLPSKISIMIRLFEGTSVVASSFSITDLAKVTDKNLRPLCLPWEAPDREDGLSTV